LLTIPDSNVAVVIWSSDSRKDVLKRVLPSLFEYWPDCPYPIYVGLNSEYWIAPNVTTLVAPPSEWRTECSLQLAQIPENYLIMMLDDFLLRKSVDQTNISSIIAKAREMKLSYLRMVPLGKSLPARLLGLCLPRSLASFELMKENSSFYCSMEIALWSKAHFLSLLESPGSIWDFEHLKPCGVAHYAVTRPAPIVYTHLVEKGLWLPYSSRLLKQAGLPHELGARSVRENWASVRIWLTTALAFIFG
jgi:hypothetical protein